MAAEIQTEWKSTLGLLRPFSPTTRNQQPSESPTTTCIKGMRDLISAAFMAWFAGIRSPPPPRPPESFADYLAGAGHFGRDQPWETRHLSDNCQTFSQFTRNLDADSLEIRIRQHIVELVIALFQRFLLLFESLDLCRGEHRHVDSIRF